ncbi:fumarylacetoacetate hydrolase family protein [Vallicoccus soli]|uniref:FAA hydrolase family protein n=1 Tax=Vallicoccus soli TaxID=2339232 RepID=A0A3A3Z654_9ACTN|nr:fumarylacetoacetate hydrolase family protein [Vallicoccus soli]RJK98468.1 FAA hydrolase family protein [Vallicoccus soli]
MRIARFSHGETVSFGAVGGEPDDLSVVPLDGHPFGQLTPAGMPVKLSEVRLLAPVLPSKVVAIGRNYADHAKEMGGDVPEVPVVFLKPSTSVVGPGEAIRYPEISNEVSYEAELAVVIGRLCRQVPVEKVPEVVLGYTCANDVTARDLQRAEAQWGRAKGFDTFCPLGPWVVTDVDPADLRVTCTVDGEVRQDGRTSQMVRSVAELVAHVSEAMTLLPGDVILTGTPAGVGPLRPGDSVTVEIEGIGSLTNEVVSRG